MYPLCERRLAKISVVWKSARQYIRCVKVDSPIYPLCERRLANISVMYTSHRRHIRCAHIASPMYSMRCSNKKEYANIRTHALRIKISQTCTLQYFYVRYHNEDRIQLVTSQFTNNGSAFSQRNDHLCWNRGITRHRQNIIIQNKNGKQNKKNHKRNHITKPFFFLLWLRHHYVVGIAHWSKKTTIVIIIIIIITETKQKKMSWTIIQSEQKNNEYKDFDSTNDIQPTTKQKEVKKQT